MTSWTRTSACFTADRGSSTNNDCSVRQSSAYLMRSPSPLSERILNLATHSLVFQDQIPHAYDRLCDIDCFIVFRPKLGAETLRPPLLYEHPHRRANCENGDDKKDHHGRREVGFDSCSLSSKCSIAEGRCLASPEALRAVSRNQRTKSSFTAEYAAIASSAILVILTANGHATHLRHEGRAIIAQRPVTVAAREKRARA